MKKLLRLVICSFLVLAPTSIGIIPRTNLYQEIYTEIQKYPNPKLLTAVIKVESRYNPVAVSTKGAVGLGQIRPAIWTKKLQEEGIIKEEQDLFKVPENIKATHFILTHYLKKHKTLKKALAKYSGGARNYHKKVMEAMDEE
jgi:soluble lytic murein transglycosylase